jgi:hypothetical protein
VDGIIRSVGLALRIPPFVVGWIGMAIYTIVLGTASAVWFFVVIPVAWVLLGVPAAFLRVSFRGKGTEELKKHIDSDLASWRATYTDHFQHFSDGFSALHRWVVTGTTAKSP